VGFQCEPGSCAVFERLFGATPVIDAPREHLNSRNELTIFSDQSTAFRRSTVYAAEP
jgi:hypothetical protein